MSDSAHHRLRVILLDDHEVVRLGLGLLLKEKYSIDVAGSFRTSQELFAALPHTKADVILVDYSLGPSEVDGVNLIRALKRRFPDERVLVISAHYNPATVALAMKAGAMGFVGKGQDQNELITAIRAVAAGRTFVDTELAQAIKELELTESGTTVEAAGNQLMGSAKLSPREQEVLRCVLDGMSIKAIAAKFSRSVTTISAQKSSAFRKLGIRTNNELFKIDHQLGQP